MTNEQQRSPIFCLDKLKKHLYNTIWGIKQLLTDVVQTCAPHWRTLLRSRLWPNVVQILPLVGGLCHAADFDKRWSEMCPSLDDFFDQVWSKHVPLVGGLCHTADFNQMWSKYVPLNGVTSFCYGVRPQMDQQCAHHQRKPVPNNRSLSFIRCGTETAISDYIAIWSMH